MPAAQFSELQTALCVVFLLLAPLALAGVALMSAGLGRSRNAAHAMMAALCVVAVAACMYFFRGAALQGYGTGAEYVIRLRGTPWSWAGRGSFLMLGIPLNGSPAFLGAWFGILGAGLAGLIPLGSGADRWRLPSICASTAILAGITFPLFAHWSWGGGWLAQLGANYGLGGGYLDAGGAGAIHVIGGLTALSLAWLLGARRGKYTPDGMPMAIPGHNAVYVLFGGMLALVGWLGLNGAGALLFAGADIDRIPLVAVNTLLCAAGAAGSAGITTRIRFGKPDASLTANGWTGGLAASSAACAFVAPAAALLLGLVAGALVAFSVEMLDVRLDVDDPGGSISVHGVGGLCGILAVGLFGRLEAAAPGQLLAQAVGIATLLGFALPLTWGLNWLLNRVLPFRVAPEGEHQGMDLYELGAGAYPEFITHTDEYTR